MTRPFLLAALVSALALSGCLVPPNEPLRTQTASGSAAASSSHAPARAFTGVTLDERVLSGGVLEFGYAQAPHTLLAVVHYGSPYSRSFIGEQLPRLRSDFLKDGLLKLQLLPLDLRKYPQSNAHASALLCAAWQGKGMDMSDAMAAGETVPEGKAITAMGMDLKAYQACLKSKDLERVRAEQKAEAGALQVTLAPTFFLDGERFQGLAEYPDLRGRIRERIEND